MLDTCQAGGLHDVKCPDNIGVEIGTRIVDAVADPGLSRQVDDRVWLKRRDGSVKLLLILKHTLGRRKTLMLVEHRVAAFFQADIIIVGHAIIAADDMALREQEFSEMVANKTSRPGDEDALSVHSLMSSRYWRYSNLFYACLQSTSPAAA